MLAIYLTGDALKGFLGTLALDWFLFVHSWHLIGCDDANVIENWIDH
jgi:hypothetical protein